MNLSQTELAARLQVYGVNLERNSICKLEAGQRFVADFELLALSKILRVDVMWLLGEDENN